MRHPRRHRLRSRAGVLACACWLAAGIIWWPGAAWADGAVPASGPSRLERAEAVQAWLTARLRAPVLAREGNGAETGTYLARAKVFLAAGDYRRALDAALFHLWDHPSVESYVYLTYVYHAIDGYLEHLAAQDRWVMVEHLFLNLAARGASDLIEPPDVLARIAKEIIHGALQRQADVTSAMAARLDEDAVNRLWAQQTAWRKAHPDDWWAGVPDAWGW